MQKSHENPPSRANVSLLNDDAALLHQLRRTLEIKRSVRLSLADVVHIALTKLNELETNTHN